ncbi:MAG: hypothetical protein P8Z81_11900 [Deinococcales bacterium]
MTAPRRSVYAVTNQDGNWWERMVQTVRLERRTPMAQMLFRTSEIMQAILVDIQYSLHPADLRIRLDMPEFRMESFREFRKIVAYGEEAAERALHDEGGLDAILVPPRTDMPCRTITPARSRLQRQG